MKKISMFLGLFLALIGGVCFGCAEENRYCKNEVLNGIIEEYDSIAEFPLENVKNGVRKNNALASCNNVWISMWEIREERISLQFTIEDYDNTAIFPVLRDFSKVLKDDIQDEYIDGAWEEVQNGKYDAYKCLRVGTLGFSYCERKLEGGKYRIVVNLERREEE